MRATQPDGVGARSPQATRVPGFSWCPLVTLWSDMVNAESHVQGRCDCLPSPPRIYALYSMRYILPVSPACAVDTATTSCVAPINGLDEPRKIAQGVAS